MILPDVMLVAAIMSNRLGVPVGVVTTVERNVEAAWPS